MKGLYNTGLFYFSIVDREDLQYNIYILITESSCNYGTTGGEK